LTYTFENCSILVRFFSVITKEVCMARIRVIEPGVELRGKPGHQELFSRPLGKVIGTEGRDGHWSGPSDSGDTIVAGSPRDLRDLQKQDSDLNF